MLIDFVAFFAKLVIALAILKLLETHFVNNNSDSAIGGALAFLVG